MVYTRRIADTFRVELFPNIERASRIDSILEALSTLVALSILIAYEELHGIKVAKKWIWPPSI